MAITKIHAITATVSDAVDYICDPNKTDESILITAYATAPGSAAYDFSFALSHTSASDPNKAYHLIQSFKPGEVSPDEAHKIGIELADRHLRGRHAYIVSTHIDKNHVHNHIIFCAADHIDYRKYHSCRSSYWDIRHISDELCASHGLSVIETDQNISKKYNEWAADKSGSSWKSQLKTDIDDAVRHSHTYQDFISIIQAKGYEVKDQGFDENSHKYIAFRAPGQERWIRGRDRSLGANYTKEKIRYRIEEKPHIRTQRMQRFYAHTPAMIDTSDARFAGSPGLEHWAEKQNLKAAARIMSILSEKGLQDMSELDAKIDTLALQSKTARHTAISIEKELKQASELLLYARQYTENKKYESAYERSKDPDRYYRNRHTEIHMAWGAKDHLKNAGLDPDKLDINRLKSMVARLNSDHEKSVTTYKSAQKECDELKKLRTELSAFMDQELSAELIRNQKRSL